ncbi:MAG: hypothetical protein ACKOTB_10420, partial [Planctomycetia bacterium]
MPLHDVGYRAWRGDRRGPGATIATIALTGIRLAWTSRWLRRMVFFAWSPALVFAPIFFAFEQAVDEGRLGKMRDAVLRDSTLDGVSLLGAMLVNTLSQGARRPAVITDDEEPADAAVEAARTRRLVWARLLLAFVRVPQALLLAIIIGLIAPTLISSDLRAKAWLIYFTRPVGRLEYVLGKASILAVLVAAETVLPSLALWILGVLVSPSISVAFDTWDLPLRVIAASVVLAVPTVLVALAYSSLTAESRIATFAWFATWAACWITHTTLTKADEVAATRRNAATASAEPWAGGSGVLQPFRGDQVRADAAGAAFEPRRPPPRTRGRYAWLMKAAGIDATVDRWAWLSPYHALGVVQAWVFGIETRARVVVPPLAALVAVSLVAVLVLFDRIAAPTRV